MSKKFFITTAIDYANSTPHIGTAYEKIGADVLARYHRMKGDDTYFLMGNDEHSVNVERKARELGLDPKEYCDMMAEKFKEIWGSLDISYNDFIRTTEPRHIRAVRAFFQKMYDKGDIYKAPYEGWYCIGCERFYREKDLVEGKCPHHQTAPTWIKEENYFFALSKYRDCILEHIEKHPDFIRPEIRRNEILNVLREGLEDISVSRSTFHWGIPLPIDESQVVYVWIDALINYISALGYAGDDDKFKRYWGPNTTHHIIGKDITRFHCIIWPAMLMAAGLPLPKTVFGHGFVYLKGERMSKSLGNVVDPLDIVKDFGPDPLRYFLMRESSFGKDGNFTWEGFIERYNGDLANDLGNLLHRTLNMIKMYQDGEILAPSPESTPNDESLKSLAMGTLGEVAKYIDDYEDDIEFHNALARIWETVNGANKYIDGEAPWQLYKDGKMERLATILYNVAEVIRIIAILIKPFMPRTAERIGRQLGYDVRESDFSEVARWGGLKPGTKIELGEPLFPRIERVEGKEEGTPRVSLSDFAKLDLRVAEVIEAEPIPKTDKLLKLRVSLGREERTIVAGIAQHFKPEELRGKRIIVIRNLEPAKIKGIESQGMLLAASDGTNLSLLTVDDSVSVGAKVS
ncbi:MAG: methionine--tRNA ligase [bacterium]